LKEEKLLQIELKLKVGGNLKFTAKKLHQKRVPEIELVGGKQVKLPAALRNISDDRAFRSAELPASVLELNCF
jgi:hypothetical protein